MLLRNALYIASIFRLMTLRHLFKKDNRFKGILKRAIYGNCIWKMDDNQKVIYLTFDDGPNPTLTPKILEILKTFNAKATFFCIGRKILDNFDIYSRIKKDGHKVGNHSFNHLDSWKVNSDLFFEDVQKAQEIVNSDLYRPPYGHIIADEAKDYQTKFGMKTIMWSIHAGEKNTARNPDIFYSFLSKQINSGSIVLFHENDNDYDNLTTALPKILKKYKEKGYSFEAIA